MRPIAFGEGLAPLDADRAVENYETMWLSSEPSLERFWGEIGANQSLMVLTALIKIDLQNRFDRGQFPTAADYLGRFPILADLSERVVSVIYEEFCLREEQGDSPDSHEFCERYHQWSDSLHSQLAYHRELSRVVGVESTPTKYPKVGERFAKYHLRSILGTGGAARVYLATEDELGGRKVALKISASVGREPSILANLDHRNIVPILTVAESVDGLRGFCMPYRPGSTLEDLIRKIGQQTLPRDARAVSKALVPAIDSESDGVETDRPGWSDFPVDGSYSEAIAWIGLSLANPLVYLHGRGVLHRDIKPANVLLAYREGPQLLDFNLAHEPNAPEHAQAAMKGGTLPFMAPEQLRAFLDPKGWDQVGAPADLYALGLVLRVLLTGQSPDLPNPKLPLTRAIQALHDRRSRPFVPVRHVNPGVPPALESIIAKSLEFSLEKRYQTATELAEDLRRFLARRPLKAATNTSMIERSVNCLYRNRLTLGGLSILLVFFFLIRTMSPAHPPTVSETPEFRQAVRDLNSADPVAWGRAKTAFESLAKLYPTSAFPRLYHGQTLEKIDHKAGNHRYLAEANVDFIESEKQPDFEKAIELRLGENQNSATLWMINAQHILRNELDGERNAKALPSLQHVVEIDPNRFEALIFIAKVEKDLSRSNEAIEHLNRAIKVGQASSKTPPARITVCRKVLLPLLLDRAEARLGTLGTPDGPRNAEETFHQMETILGALEHDWKTGPVTEDSAERDFFRHYYGGSLAMGRATLASFAGEKEVSQRYLDEARHHFQQELAEIENQSDREGRASALAKILPRLRDLEDRSPSGLSPKEPCKTAP